MQSKEEYYHTVTKYIHEVTSINITASVAYWLACSPPVRYIVDSSPGRVKPRTITLVFVASPLSTQHYGERARIGWLGIRIMCPNGVIFLPANCCLSESALYKSNSACWSRTKRTSSSSH
jgi:hypothetical protein